MQIRFNTRIVLFLLVVLAIGTYMYLNPDWFDTMREFMRKVYLTP